MSFSYTLFLALLLLAPGLAVWAGLRAGERSELISQAPEKPGSTFSLLVIVFGALAGHIILSGLFALQSGACRFIAPCVRLSFDPNVYRVILTNGRSAGVPSDWAFLCWFVSLATPALITGALAYLASGWKMVRDMREAATFGWLKRWVDLARPSNSFIIAYVVTTLEHQGANVAYEGIVENIALDDNKAIAMLVLSSCDRFLVRITSARVERIDSDHAPIPLIQLEAKQFVNVALEVFEDIETPPVDEDSHG
ncbi:hypothetical protein [Sphingomonas sp. NFR15]|uniref:hypothetical protein n=1 Tax=Sphingomonas sp. NFR15 TaxID=1566282 RepID=UPI00087FA418|nr:hypothetical protein [Sphingomonas sp. NFR15]SDA33347.1 hypothetical protein SAMN03159340_02888 [Sphingomonas sp. NFR15]